MAVLGQEGPQSPMRKHVSDRMTELEPRRQEIHVEMEKLDMQIRHLEERRVDAVIIRQGLQNFMKLFGKLKPEEQVELIQLLIERVLWDKAKNTVHIALRPLPAVWGDMEALTGLFYERWDILPVSDPDAKQSTHDSAIKCADWVWHRAPFGQIPERRGRKRFVTPEEWEAHQHRRALKAPKPKPPPIQALLRTAYHFKERLDSTPGLNRLALARDLGMDPSQLTRILNLLNLAPKIQTCIWGLKPTIHKSPIKDRDWHRLARIRDLTLQFQEFEYVLHVAKSKITSQVSASSLEP